MCASFFLSLILFDVLVAFNILMVLSIIADNRYLGYETAAGA